MTRIAALVAGAIAMIAGASTFSWWRFSSSEGLGLRELHICAFDSCKAYNYTNVVGTDNQTFVTLGMVACYGAFAVAALGLIATFTWWQKTAVATDAARTTAVLALAMLGVAIAFVVKRPDELNLSQSTFEKAHFYMRATSLGWSAIAYFGGAALVAIASALLGRRRAA